MTFVLVPSRQLTANRLGVTGNVERVVRERGLIAVVSHMSWLSIGGRIVSFGQPLQHIVVADERSERRIGTFDRCQYPVRDLALHPTAPELAIATGVYGGQMDQNDGHLLIWNWETDAWRSVFSEERTIERVEYRDGGRRLAVLARAPIEEGAYVGGVLEDLTARAPGRRDPRLRKLSPVDPASIGLPLRTYDLDKQEARGLFNNAPVLELAWLEDGWIAAAYSDDRVELWHPAGPAPRVLRVPGQFRQLLPHAGGLLVNALERIVDGRVNEAVMFREQTTLCALRGDELVPWKVLSSERMCSIDTSGRVLARRTDLQSRADIVLDRDGKVLREIDLGAPVKSVRIEGPGGLYFVRAIGGTRDQALCSIDSKLAVRQQMQWTTSGPAIFVDGDLIRAHEEQAPAPAGPREPRASIRASTRASIERRRVGASAPVWRQPTSAAVVALAHGPAARCVMSALVDGTLCALDVETGAVLHQDQLRMNDRPVLVTALAVRDEQLVIGTLDGQLSIFAAR